MKILVIVAVILVAMVRAGPSAGDFDYLVEIQPTEFSKVVLADQHVWLVHFSQGDEDVLGELQKTAAALGGVFRVGSISLSAAKKNGVSVPQGGSLFYYGDDKEAPLAYKGDTKFNEYVKFVLANTKELIEARSRSARSVKEHQEYLDREAQRAEKEATDEAKLREKSDTIVLSATSFKDVLMKSREPYVVNIYVANCSSCIELNKEWEAVSTELKGKVKVAKLNLTEHSELEEVFQLKDFPAIKFYPGGVKKQESAIDFSGVKKKFSMIEWILKSNDKQASNDLAQLNAADYKTVCKEGKGTCVIFFLDSANEETLAKLSALPNNYLKKPISFFYTTKGSQQEFAKQFGVETYPNVLMTYCHRKTFWRLDHFDLGKVEQAVGEVLLGNRNNFAKYKFEEVLA